MGVVCFRYVPAGLDEAAADRLNEHVVESINASGLAYLTHTQVGGRTVMRVGIGNILTMEQQLEDVWTQITGVCSSRFTVSG